MSDQVGNPAARFSHNEAHILPVAKQIEETEKDESSDSSDDGEFDDSDVTTTTTKTLAPTRYL